MNQMPGVDSMFGIGETVITFVFIPPILLASDATVASADEHVYVVDGWDRRSGLNSSLRLMAATKYEFTGYAAGNRGGGC